MHCTNCGSAQAQPTGFCGTCGQTITSPAAATSGPPPAWPPSPGDGPVDMDATIQFTMPPIDPYEYAADATAQFAAIPREVETDNEPVTGVPLYTGPLSPFLGYGPPVSPALPPVYGNPISPAGGYGPPGYGGPAQVPAYAHQYAAPDGYALPTFPVAGQPYGSPAFNAPVPQPAPTPVPQVYGPPEVITRSTYVPYPSGVPARVTSKFSIGAFVLAAIAVLATPIFGVVAIVLASMARTRGERQGELAFKVSITATAISCVLFALAFVFEMLTT